MTGPPRYPQWGQQPPPAPPPAAQPPPYWGPPQPYGQPYGSPAPYYYPRPPQAYVEPPRNPTTLARLAQWSLVPGLLATLVVLGVEVRYLTIVAGMSETEYAGSGRLVDAQDLYEVVGTIASVAWLLAPGFVVAWTFRVFRNARGLGAPDQRHDQIWSILGWFVPVVWWWMPLVAINDTWRSSDPELGHLVQRHEWENKPVPWIFLVWWLSWIVGWILWIGADEIYTDATDPATDTWAISLAILGSVLTIAAAILAMRVIAMVTRRQVARAEARERSGSAQAAAAATTPAAQDPNV